MDLRHGGQVGGELIIGPGLKLDPTCKWQRATAYASRLTWRTHLRPDIIDITQRSSVETMPDIILRNLDPSLKQALRALDILIVNETESAWLAAHLGCADGAAALRAALDVTIIRTLGGDGLEVADAGGVTRVPAFAITPVDTTAAGDCFTGVFAAALDRGAPPREALRRAAAAAALCCTCPGSQGSLPEGRETDAFLAERRARNPAG